MKSRTMIILGVLMTALVLVPSSNALWQGIGSGGNAGCTCHTDSNGANPATVITVEGLPDVFNSSESYDFTVTIVNDNVARSSPDSGRLGGFRILTTAGVVETTIPEYGQEMDGGLTHTPEATYFRSWNFTWTAPADDTETAEFTIYGNAVSGGDGSGGDIWNVASPVVPGLNADAQAPSAPSCHPFDGHWIGSGAHTRWLDVGLLHPKP